MNAGATHVDFQDPVHAALCLSMVSGVGPRNFRALIEAFGTPAAVLQAAPSQLREVDGIGTQLARSISRATEQVDVAAEIERCRQHQFRLIPRHDSYYPTRLNEIDDAPGVLYACGELLSADDLAIAIVGTRHATHYGLRQAERLAHGLALAGFTIVSGLARGIDAAAHRGTLEAGGRTIAVLGSGLLNLYPPEHAELAQQIAGQGALLSEYPTMQSPKSGAFPQRNRIITGLSLGLIVVEAADRSGAFISARHAMEQGREVFAVPGSIGSRMSRGCHRLIRDGAKLVESISDVIEELGPLATPMKTGSDAQLRHPAEVTLNEQEQIILNAIETEATEIDAIVDATGLPVHRILATVSVLEMRHLIERTSGTSIRRR